MIMLDNHIESHSTQYAGTGRDLTSSSFPVFIAVDLLLPVVSYLTTLPAILAHLDWAEVATEHDEIASRIKSCILASTSA
mmetsp:Transcript_2224/g.5095  ORF Transcript_2224/g.5095 Transcript_2224/m.5095 type:complete len:80 (-) Transcript_2224:2713-2952(-)